MSEIKSLAAPKASFDRRAVVKGAAWSVPVIAAAIAAPAAAASAATRRLRRPSDGRGNAANVHRLERRGNDAERRPTGFTIHNTTGAAIDGDAISCHDHDHARQPQPQDSASVGIGTALSRRRSPAVHVRTVSSRSDASALWPPGLRLSPSAYTVRQATALAPIGGYYHGRDVSSGTTPVHGDTRRFASSTRRLPARRTSPRSALTAVRLQLRDSVLRNSSSDLMASSQTGRSMLWRVPCRTGPGVRGGMRLAEVRSSLRECVAGLVKLVEGLQRLEH